MNALIKLALDEKRSFTEPEARDLLSEYGLPLSGYSVATNAQEAVTAATEIGFPVVLKIVSPDIVHKTEAGGVKVGLGTPEDVSTAFDTIIAKAKRYKADADIHGVMVTSMAEAGLEVIIGAVRDPQFGSVVMFGLGGVLVEIFRDVSFRVAPLTKADALKMLDEIKSAPLLKGYRGDTPKDIEALVQALVTVSTVMEENPEIKEIDLNPIFVYERGIVAVDARVILKNQENHAFR